MNNDRKKPKYNKTANNDKTRTIRQYQQQLIRRNNTNKQTYKTIKTTANKQQRPSKTNNDKKVNKKCNYKIQTTARQRQQRGAAN